MKLSLSWIFDHINGSWKEYDIPTLVQKFNTTTAEIESFKKINLDLQNFFLVKVLEIRQEDILLFCPELAKELALPKRTDAEVQKIYMVKKKPDGFRWATLDDWHANKEGLLPAFSCAQADLAGNWKNYIESEDYIFELDNKSITNRPDLWGHRGIAREIAAILDLPLKPLELFLADLPIKKYENFASGTPENPFTIEIKDSKAAPRFSGLYISEITPKASWLWMAYRLARVEAKPIDAIVDLTNYVMIELSQPMHAFDAIAIETKKIGPRFAKFGQKLTLLDGKTIELTEDDLVISDGKNPIALAGIMGGASTAVSAKTRALFLESACFDAATIRKTSQRFHLRTEASARFEKSLDPNQNVYGLLRFLKLAEQENMTMVVADHIVSLGHEAQPKIIDIEHAFIEQCIGTTIESVFVEKCLSVLGFEVKKNGLNNSVSYSISVPAFRATKDVNIPEDIVEEVARFYGYDAIPRVLPSKKISIANNAWVFKKSAIKELCAFGMAAREVLNYAIYDEQFLQELRWHPEHALTIKNPISEHWQKMVTSLIPHLLKNIMHNVVHYDSLRFFEWNTIWQKNKDDVVEQQSLSGIFFEKKKKVDFYHCKHELTTLFESLDLTVTWHKLLNSAQPWYHPFQTAQLQYNGTVIGTAGMINQEFLMHLTEGEAFIFELDAQKLLEIMPEPKKYTPLPKFPGTSMDISLFLPLQVTVEQVSELIQRSDSRIYHVALIDFFQKDEWIDKRAITMRFQARDPERTLAKDDIENIYNHVVVELKKINAIVR
jgi:phenylalanyl-tRNA synthetase beta chain